MLPIKAAFFDFDNTYYSHFSHGVPESNAIAVRELQKRGIECWISTGRSRPELHDLGLKDTDFDGMLVVSGQLGYYKGERILSRPFIGEMKQKVIELFNAKTFPIMFDEAECVYMNYADERVKAIMAGLNTPVPESREYTGNEIYMATVMADKETLAMTAELFRGCTPCVWHENGVDYVPPNGGKAAGIAAVLEYFGWKREEIIAFGDNDNDISMLEYAGLSVAMGNGTDAAKAAADYVTDHVEEQGIYRALKHFEII